MVLVGIDKEALGPATKTFSDGVLDIVYCVLRIWRAGAYHTFNIMGGQIVLRF